MFVSLLSKLTGGAMSSVVKSSSHAFIGIKESFAPNKEKQAERDHAVRLAEIGYRTQAFRSRLYQITGSAFVLLFVILVLSPILSRIPFSFFQGILTDYLNLYEGIGHGVVMTVLGSILGIDGLAKLVKARSMHRVIENAQKESEKTAIEKEKTERLKSIAEIKANGGAYTFEDCFKKLMKHEGDYVNDPADRGGETYKGISRKFHGDWDGWKIIDGFKKKHKGVAFKKALSSHQGLHDEVEDFYEENYWKRTRCDKITSGIIRGELFDTAVNTGIKQASKFLQRAINVASKGLPNEVRLQDDGKVGEVTLNALDSLIPRYEAVVFKLMNYFQAHHYVLICQKKASQWRFIRGWISRT